MYTHLSKKLLDEIFGFEFDCCFLMFFVPLVLEGKNLTCRWVEAITFIY